MDISISKEIRWFLKQDEMEPVEDWFEKLNPSQKFNSEAIYPREDYYLSMPGIKNLGIKIREPKKDPNSGKLKTAFEVKQQVSANEVLVLANDNTAYSNKWQKFSYEIIDGQQNILNVDFSLPASDKNWVRISKDRLMIIYDAEKKSIVKEDSPLNEACGIELTKISVDGKIYYSFGLEAFSKSGKRLDENFNAACDFVFNSIAIKGFKLKNSLSYPEFLFDHQSVI